MNEENSKLIVLEEPQTPATQEAEAKLPHRTYQGINIGGDTVTQATDHLPEEQKHLVRWIYNHARNEKWDWATFVAETGLDRSQIYRVFTDSYRYPKVAYRVEKGTDGEDVKIPYPHPKANQRIPLDGVCEKITTFKLRYEALRGVASEDFIETSVWEKVEWLCDMVFKRHKMGFLYGDSQLGKSTCLKEYTRRNNHGQTTYFEMPPSAGVQLMTKTLAKALHVSACTCFENLLEDVIHALDSSKLLIVDEIHRVFTTYQKTSVMRCMDVLRYIHDQTKCGMILCGTNVFRDQVREGEFFRYLSQLKRRGLYELQLSIKPKRSDLDLICAAYGLPPAQDFAEETLLYIANKDGFGVVCTRLADAKGMAEKAKEPLTWAHFIKAYNIVREMSVDPEEEKKQNRK
jgi:DNA transposition AAA+ family ATPase